jgi:hypothetical protein
MKDVHIKAIVYHNYGSPSPAKKKVGPPLTPSIATPSTMYACSFCRAQLTRPEKKQRF